MSMTTQNIAQHVNDLQKKLEQLGPTSQRTAYANLIRRQLIEAKQSLEEEREMDYDKSWDRCR